MPTLTCAVEAHDAYISIMPEWGGAASSGNKLWRRAADEYGGAFILLTDRLEFGGTVDDETDDPLLDEAGDLILAESGGVAFKDYDVASGKTYSYYIEITSTGQTSAVASASLSLPMAYLHAVTKFSGMGNLLVGSVMFDQSHSRQFSFASTLQVPANAALPVIKLSPIEEGTISMATIIPQSVDSNRASLRAIYTSRRIVCLRDAFGNKWFGRLSEFREVPRGVNFEFNFSLQVLNFNESLI